MRCTDRLRWAYVIIRQFGASTFSLRIEMGLMYEMNSLGADVLLFEYDSIRSLPVISRLQQTFVLPEHRQMDKDIDLGIININRESPIE
jgi:hypothetical protein